MALVTTVSTTPLTKLLYPVWYQKKLEKWRRGEIDWDGNVLRSEESSQRESVEKFGQTQIRRLLVYLRLDSLPGLFTFISLLGGENDAKQAPPAQLGVTSGSPDDVQLPGQSAKRRPLEVHGIRILELTERTSSVMQVTEGEEYSQRDPVVNTFRAFSQLHDVAVSGHVAVVPADSYAETLMGQAAEVSSDFALIPWSEYGSVTEDQSVPFAVSARDRFHGRAHLEFVHKTLTKAVCNTGIFIDNGFGGMPRAERPILSRAVSALSLQSHREPATMPAADKSHRVFFPFFGGVDDRVALRFVLQLAKNKNVVATIAHFNWPAEDHEDGSQAPEITRAGSSYGEATATLKPSKSKAPETESHKVMDELTAQDLAVLAALQSSPPPELVGRVTFSEINVVPTTALSQALSFARETVGGSPNNSGDIIVVGRRHHRLGDSTAEGGNDLRRTIGVVGEHIVSAAVKASILVVQAGGRGLDW